MVKQEPLQHQAHPF